MPDKQPKVGDKIQVNMHAGKIVDAMTKAIINSTDGVKYQVDFGHNQMALIELRIFTFFHPGVFTIIHPPPGFAFRFLAVSFLRGNRQRQLV